MLCYQTVDTSTLELLKRLQGMAVFKNLRLAGGTSLALQKQQQTAIFAGNDFLYLPKQGRRKGRR